MNWSLKSLVIRPPYIQGTHFKILDGRNVTFALQKLAALRLEFKNRAV